MLLHKFHRTSAGLIGIFIMVHLLNHFFILGGVEQHIFVMDKLRFVYRNILVETFLLICVLYQIGSGLYFVFRRRDQRKLSFEKAQALSGLYLAYFFLNHVGAVIFGRVFFGLDTNIYYGIAGIHAGSFQWYFNPYYFLAIVALFVHLASAYHWLNRNNTIEPARTRIAHSIILIGILMATTLMLGFGGAFSEIVIPPEYRAIYE